MRKKENQRRRVREGTFVVVQGYENIRGWGGRGCRGRRRRCGRFASNRGRRQRPGWALLDGRVFVDTRASEELGPIYDRRTCRNPRREGECEAAPGLHFAIAVVRPLACLPSVCPPRSILMAGDVHPPFPPSTWPPPQHVTMGAWGNQARAQDIFALSARPGQTRGVISAPDSWGSSSRDRRPCPSRWRSPGSACSRRAPSPARA